MWNSNGYDFDFWGLNEEGLEEEGLNEEEKVCCGLRRSHSKLYVLSSGLVGEDFECINKLCELISTTHFKQREALTN